MEATVAITGFKLFKDGFVIRLPSDHDVVEDPGEFVSSVLDGFDGAMSCTFD